MSFKTFFKDARIRTKFNLFLIFVFAIGLAFSSITLWTALEQRAQAEITSKAMTLMQVMNSIRTYTQEQVNPLLRDRLKDETSFTPQAIPTFPVREIFEDFRKTPGYENFFYKDAAPNPTNPRDQADDFESQLVEQFRARAIPQISGWRDLPEGKLFYVARPFAVTKQSCLECHSSPAKAPKSLLLAYGTEHGFGWKIGDVVAAQVIYVPAEDIFASAYRSFSMTLIIFAATLGVILLFINFLLKYAVIRRIQNIARIAQAISIGEMTVEFKEDSKDEIGLLAIAFNRMRFSLEAAIKLLGQRKQ